MGTVKDRHAAIKASFVERARRSLAEIEQYMIDVASWNDNHPQELPIDPDPDGKLAETKAMAERIVAAGSH